MTWGEYLYVLSLRADSEWGAPLPSLGCDGVFPLQINDQAVLARTLY